MRAVPLVAILGLCFVGSASVPLNASDDRRNEKPYLALGDSVAFGFMPLPGFEAVNAANFVGYPDSVGRALRLTTVSGSCPGETSGSFLDEFTADNGCRDYRAQPLPLHAAYDGTQGAFAVEFVRANPQTRLVTIQLGANDLFVLQDRCFGLPTCIASILPFTLAILEQNILTTIANLRAAGYRRPIVIVNYYPLDLNDTQSTAFIGALNAALADAAARGGAIVADTFTPFARAVTNPFAAGSPCRAGLLKANPLSDPAHPTCDVHPSQTGHGVIANAIVKALRQASEHDN
jgi:lysophospholipase L1-like esterase